MILPITYPSAADFWMQTHFLNFHEHTLKNRKYISLPKSYKVPTDPDFFGSVSTEYNLQYPIHFLSSTETRRISKISKSHMCHHLPNNAFIEIESYSIKKNYQHRLCVASPEYCFLLAAEKLPLLELIKFGYDLCAMYVQDDNEIQQRNPITKVKNIERFLSRSGWSKGIKKARQAIQYVTDRSRSPMETAMCMFAVLPYSLGGFSISKPELNKDIIVSSDSASLLKREQCCCDMVWENKKVVAEYDSTEFHLNKDAHSWDKAKETALSCSGYTVLCLTQDNFKNVQSVQATYSQIRRMLGLRNNEKRLKETWDARVELLKLFKRNNTSNTDEETIRRDYNERV